MARKSKYAAPEAVQELKNTIFNTSGYVRLSNEDGDEAVSLENQEQMVRNFIAQKSDMKLHSIFSDNGLTGTNFQRSGFEALMNGIRRGEINCVVVKDLSRFGRDYIETGNYIETVFPQLGIRFISINDNFDSFDPRCWEDGISIALKNIINAAYAKDISLKLRTSYDTRRRRGDYTGAHPPFGYTRSPENKGKLVIDEEAAEIVKNIFQWRIEGATLEEIAKRLDSAGVPNPTHYAYLKGRRNDKRFAKAQPWESVTVRIMLNSIVYLGHVALGKNIAVAMGKRVSQPKENWCVTYNTHEPIVSQGDFDIVQEITHQAVDRRKQRWDKRTGNPLPENIFKGLIFCSVCGHSFGRISQAVESEGNRKICYTCLTCRKRRTDRQTRILLTELQRVIFDAVIAQIRTCVSSHAIAEKIRLSDPAIRRFGECNKEIEAARKRLAHIESGKERTLCDYYDGLLSKEDYEFVIKQRDVEQLALIDRLEALLSEQKLYQPAYWDNNQCVSMFEQFLDEKELSREMLTSLVERIEVTHDFNVHIRFRYQDEFAALQNFVDENGGTGND